MNQITHWLDASNIYGSNEHEQEQLREHSDGLLKITRQVGTKFGMLPSCSAARRGDIEMCKNCNKCFFAGNTI